MLSSTLAAGVRGISGGGRFDGTTGVMDGETVGKATDDEDGVDNGVIMLPAALVSGTEWWWAIDCNCRVCCWV